MKSSLHTSLFLVGSFLVGAFVGGFTSNKDGHLTTVTTNQEPQWALHETDDLAGTRSVGRMKPDGTKAGHWQSFHRNGWQWNEGRYSDDGLAEGRWTFWHDNGQKQEQGDYINDKKDGLWMSWHNNGQKESEGVFRHGLAEGRWTSWREDGAINPENSGTYQAGSNIAPLPDK